MFCSNYSKTILKHSRVLIEIGIPPHPHPPIPSHPHDRRGEATYRHSECTDRIYFANSHQLSDNNFVIGRACNYQWYITGLPLKSLHTIGKVSVNVSILYKNQEICNKTNLWKFQLISLFLLRENSKNAFSIFVFILMTGVFVSRDENSLLDIISIIIRKRYHIRQKYFKESFIPCKLCVNLWTF